MGRDNNLLNSFKCTFLIQNGCVDQYKVKLVNRVLKHGYEVVSPPCVQFSSHEVILTAVDPLVFSSHHQANQAPTHFL